MGKGFFTGRFLCPHLTEERHHEETHVEVSLGRPGWGLWSRMTAGAPAWEGPGSSGFPSWWGGWVGWAPGWDWSLLLPLSHLLFLPGRFHRDRTCGSRRAEVSSWPLSWCLPVPFSRGLERQGYQAEAARGRVCMCGGAASIKMAPISPCLGATSFPRWHVANTPCYPA